MRAGRSGRAEKGSRSFKGFRGFRGSRGCYRALKSLLGNEILCNEEFNKFKKRFSPFSYKPTSSNKFLFKGR
ncbi:MAG: hypothetical protein DI535_07360 [Citrobacter freundii]|nr:MAG: hypothetical protein DI535_07360 [Citrobacter freundii]